MLPDFVEAFAVMTDYSVALWSFNVGRAPSSVEALAAEIDLGMARASASGARLLMLPEYFIECCLAYKPADLRPDQEMGFLADQGRALLPLLKGLPGKHGLSLLCGTVPVRQSGGLTNTAILLTADGREIQQDKLCLTPSEQDAEAWSLAPGQTLKVFDLDGLKMAILICLDVEVPALSSLLAQQDLDLLLVPSMTEKLSGYHRVYGCAKARAVELMCAVAVCGVVGTAIGTTQNETNVSGASLYLPCEEELGFKGLAAEYPPTDGLEGQEPFVVAEVPFARIRQLKSGAAEVWPGAWNAAHVRIDLH